MIVAACLIATAILGSSNLFGQHETSVSHVCPSSFVTQAWVAQAGLQDLAAEDMQEKNQTSVYPSASRSVKTVPVVFHIVYNNAAENISDLEVLRILNVLNEDFRMSGSLTSSIRPEFLGVASDAGIQFCLASKDPQGIPTKGITRTFTDRAYFSPFMQNPNGNVGGVNSMKTAAHGKEAWDRTQYVNIWICNISNGAQSGTAGYAYTPLGTSPAGLPPAAVDGLVLDYNLAFQPANEHIVSHEMGHFFGLKHAWGDAIGGVCNSGDDGFQDTPTIKGAFSQYYPSCAAGHDAAACTAGQSWQYENLMDYSTCISMFTHQQANYMNAVLENSRASLLNDAVTHCGIETPIVSFAGCRDIAPNSSVTFENFTIKNPDNYEWEITPASGWYLDNGATLTDQNLQVVFTEAGSYSVTLRASNMAGEGEMTESSCITVLADMGTESLTADYLTLFPNPTQGFVNVKAPADGFSADAQIRVYNMLGALVFQTNTGTAAGFDISHLNNGVYFTELISGGTTFTGRIVLAK